MRKDGRERGDQSCFSLRGGLLPVVNLRTMAPVSSASRPCARRRERSFSKTWWTSGWMPCPFWMAWVQLPKRKIWMSAAMKVAGMLVRTALAA